MMRRLAAVNLPGALVLGIGLLLVGTACGHVTGTIRSQVVDAQTGQPIPGAVALGVWTSRAGLPGLAYGTLVGVQEAETDAEGRFGLERPAGAYGAEYESITVYTFGYVAWNNHSIFPSGWRKDTSVPAWIRLDPFPPGESRQRHIDFISIETGRAYGTGATPKFQSAIRREIELR